MHRYMIMSPHTAEECTMAIKHFRDYHAGFLSHFDWGCYDNDHTAYRIVEADSHEEAKLAVPPLFREKTRVIQLTRFNPKKTSDPLHQTEKKPE
jgi:hypothetical protein